LLIYINKFEEKYVKFEALKLKILKKACKYKFTDSFKDF